MSENKFYRFMLRKIENMKNPIVERDYSRNLDSTFLEYRSGTKFVIVDFSQAGDFKVVTPYRTLLLWHYFKKRLLFN